MTVPRSASKSTPIAAGKLLRYPTPVGIASELIGSDAWFQWLEGKGNSTFYVEGFPYNYTARRELRRNLFYWYAFMKLNDTLYKVYMGQSHKLNADYIFHIIPRALDDKYYARIKN